MNFSFHAQATRTGRTQFFLFYCEKGKSSISIHHSTTTGCHLTTKEGISGLTSFFKKIALWLMIITNSKMISNLSSDKICKQNFNENFRLDNYKLWSELSMAHLIRWLWDVLSRGLWSLEDTRAPHRQEDTLSPAIFSPGFTDLTFHKLMSIPPEIEKQMLPFTGPGTAHLDWVCRCPRTRLDKQHPKTCNFLPSQPQCWRASGL